MPHLTQQLLLPFLLHVQKPLVAHLSVEGLWPRRNVAYGLSPLGYRLGKLPAFSLWLETVVTPAEGSNSFSFWAISVPSVLESRSMENPDAWPNAFPRVSTNALAQAVNVVEESFPSGIKNSSRKKKKRRAPPHTYRPSRKANAPKERLLASDPARP